MLFMALLLMVFDIIHGIDDYSKINFGPRNCGWFIGWIHNTGREKNYHEEEPLQVIATWW